MDTGGGDPDFLATSAAAGSGAAPAACTPGAGPRASCSPVRSCALCARNSALRIAARLRRCSSSGDCTGALSLAAAAVRGVAFATDVRAWALAALSKVAPRCVSSESSLSTGDSPAAVTALGGASSSSAQEEWDQWRVPISQSVEGRSRRRVRRKNLSPGC